MAESTTVARPYARAIFAQTGARKTAMKKWSEVLAVATLVAENPVMARFLGSPSVSADDKAEAFAGVLAELAGEKALTGPVRNFLRLLAANHRLPVLPAISGEFERLRDEAERTVKAEVFTALPISDEQRERLAAALKARLDREVELEVRLDESLIGGVVIRAGDLVIDGSARGRLNQLATALSR